MRLAELMNHIITFEITFTVNGKEKDAQSGLRSISLHVLPSLREEHAIWPNGEPISADAEISSYGAKTIIEKLADHGIIDAADRYYSNRIQHPKSKPPAGATPFKGQGSALPGAVRITFSDEDWYSYFESCLETRPMLELLADIEKIVDETKAKAIIINLRSTLVNPTL